MERMTIGEFAELAGLTPKALRLYDETGLLVPAEVDAANGYRYYVPGQLGRARLVARLRLVGMPLARIRTVADLPPAAAAAAVTSYWRQVEADTRSRRSRVLALVDELRAKETMMTTHTSTGAAEAAGVLAQGGRTAQQDALHLGEDVWVVADGFGTADGLAARAVAGFVAEPANAGDPVAALDAAVARAQSVLEGAGHGGTAGTTLTAVRLLDGQVAVAHVGDSRAWLRRDGELTLLTRDHTEVQSLVDDGALTEDEARTDPRRSLLNRALAAGLPGEADTFLVPVRPGDRLVLTTDGTHAVLPPETLAEQLGAGSPQEAVDRVAAAVAEAGAPDNYAVVVVDVP